MDNFLNKYKNEMIKNLMQLINIKSVYKKSNDKNKPFGNDINNALIYALELGKKLGFKTKNIDGYCGIIEFGKGSLFGIVAHLDVVPGKDECFKSYIKDGKIYGRGAIDDKGPVISVLYAMKFVMDNFKVNKRIRLILGLDEERNWKCIDYYKKHEEIPLLGFTPDSKFPCIYKEKSIFSFYLSKTINKNKFISIEKIECNNRINVVPKYCSINLKCENLIDVLNYITKINKKYNFNIEITSKNSLLTISSFGKEAHASLVEEGINAITKLIILLNDVLNHFNIPNELFDYVVKYFNKLYYKNISINVGNIVFEKNNIYIYFNLRVPIEFKFDELNEKIKNTLKTYKINYKVIEFKDGFLTDKNSELVKTLCSVFNKENNSNYKPITSGGATYARAFKNFVAFGANMPLSIDMSHKENEYISINNLLFSFKIYAKAIYELTKKK